MRSPPGILLRRKAVSRRQFLTAGLGAAAVLGGPLGCGSDEGGDPPDVTRATYDPKLPALSWLSDARVAGFESHLGYPEGAVKVELDRLLATHVNVVIVDSDLSYYSDDAAFAEQVGFVDLVAREARARGMRSLAYIPMLEILTEDVENVANSAYKDHPDWVQVGIDGKHNVFVGGEGRVFWVPPGTESAWLCPTSGYRDFWLARVKLLAATRLDGIWGDVPLLSDIVGVWPCTNASCAAKFKADTGLDLPAVVDWDDPVFRRWVGWRHRLIHEFEQATLAAARGVRPDFQLVVETVTMDYTGGTAQGLDGASHADGGVLRAWEIDAVSDASSMRAATADDWISLAIMMRHGAGASRPNPSWAITYGKQADDAERVMAAAIVGGVRPYETQIPVLNASVGEPYRARMYGWLKENADLWAGESANPVAVVFSSFSRDFVDQVQGVGLYTSTNRADPLWWSTLDEDSAHALPYLGEYRGMCKALMHANAPYDLVTTPHLDAATLARYRLVVLPRPAALSSAHVGALRAYVEGGGTLLVTGPEPGRYDEDGAERDAPALIAALGLPVGAGRWTRVTRGGGSTVYAEEQAGLRYFKGGDREVFADLGVVLDATRRSIVSDAAPAVLFDLRQASDVRLNLLCANLDGLDERRFVARGASFRAAVDLGGKTPLRVTLSEPGPAGPPRELPFAHEDGRAAFDVAMSALALVRIDLG